MAIDPLVGTLKIEHLVILMMENRSFDHYLGALALDPPYTGKVDGLKDPPFTNPDSNDQPVPAWPIDRTPTWPADVKYFGYPDLPHGPGPQVANYNDGKNDGFVNNYYSYLLKADPPYEDRPDSIAPQATIQP